MKRTKIMNEKMRLLIAALLIIACILANWSVRNSADQSSLDSTTFRQGTVTTI